MSLSEIQKLVKAVRGGDRRALGRAITLVESIREDHREQAEHLQEALLPHRVDSIRVGISGVPGVGKSTFIEALGQHIINKGRRIAVLAVDPSSKLSGGSILGDKTRMETLSRQQNAFIRPSPAGTTLGGVARRTREAISICEAARYDVVLVETVGVGQDEVDIARASHTTIVVSAPGLGDGIQAIKAGILEIADIHVVSKCDRSDANFTLRDLKTSLLPGGDRAQKATWVAPIIATSAIEEQGFDDLIKAIQNHRTVAFDSDAGRKRQQHIAAFRLHKTAEAMLLDHFGSMVKKGSAPLVARLEQRNTDPYSAAEEMLAAFLKAGVR